VTSKFNYPADYTKLHNRIKDMYRQLNTTGVDRVDDVICGFDVCLWRRPGHPSHLGYKSPWDKTYMLITAIDLTEMLYANYMGMWKDKT